TSAFLSPNPTMSKNSDEDHAKGWLEQLRCHLIDDTKMPELEKRILSEIEFLDTKNHVGIQNLLAKHLKGQNEEVLESLKKVEDLIQGEHANQSDMRRLVTWGKYAWLYYHLGRLAEVQIYLEKVENTCRKFASPSCYRMECPEVDYEEEWWALLKCGDEQVRALEVDPENPEFSIGYAITTYGLVSFNKVSQLLKKTIRLNPEEAYTKALLTLKLQDVGQEAKGEKYIEEAYLNLSIFGKKKKRLLDKALWYLKTALQAIPFSAFLHHYHKFFKYRKLQTDSLEDREPVDRASSKAHFELALEQTAAFDIAYILLVMYIEAGNYRNAENTYQKVLIKSLEEEKLQEIYFYYGWFQKFQRKSEADAMIHYLKALKIEEASLAKDKSIIYLEKKLEHPGIMCKLKGEMIKALEYYEQALRLAAHSENSEG
uniref:Interferon induced protein with tetratricopeptide repeats 1B n=1 Tax=Myotis lucifugus TaxID=59463 RepID=G1Q7M2_MYOLU